MRFALNAGGPKTIEEEHHKFVRIGPGTFRGERRCEQFANLAARDDLERIALFKVFWSGIKHGERCCVERDSAMKKYSRTIVGMGVCSLLPAAAMLFLLTGPAGRRRRVGQGKGGAMHAMSR
jgi:hypothetical protein